jgi:hypothetical protein
VVTENGSLMLEWRVAGWKKRMDVMDLIKKKEKRVVKQKPKTGGLGISFSQVKAVMGSFKVNTFSLRVSFDDVILNAWLFPVFFELSRYSGKEFSINFIQENEVKIEIENTLARVLWAFFIKSRQL